MLVNEHEKKGTEISIGPNKLDILTKNAISFNSIYLVRKFVYYLNFIANKICVPFQCCKLTLKTKLKEPNEE